MCKFIRIISLVSKDYSMVLSIRLQCVIVNTPDVHENTTEFRIYSSPFYLTFAHTSNQTKYEL